MTNIESNKKRLFLFKRDSIAQRLLLYIIIFSSFVTLISTSFQLYTDYTRDIDLINGRLNDIENSYLASISASLWNLDIKQLELQMDGIKHLPDIKTVEVIEKTDNFSNPLYLIRGIKDNEKGLFRSFPIIHQSSNENKHIGTLSIHASLNEVYQRLLDKAIVILLSQGIKTFLVSMFTLYIFYIFVTRHLTEMANFVKNIDSETLHEKLILRRHVHHKNDELDHVVEAFNNMSENLAKTYGKLKEANSRLERDIIARQKAENEVIHLNRVLEQRVKQRTSELEAANKELDSFCYSVSHDLRAPLRRVEGFRKIFSDGYHSIIDSKGQHYLSRIEAGTREMAGMIDSFLHLARNTQGEMNIKSYNISEIAKTAISNIRERDPERNINIYIQENMHANVDKHFFEVLLNNLLENAWKYSRNENLTKISFSEDTASGESIYCITDNGAGFDMAYADRLFSPFSRLHKQEDFEGVGIGLATVQRIIARHGGKIWAKSSPQQGAKFYFSLWSKDTDNDK